MASKTVDKSKNKCDAKVVGFDFDNVFIYYPPFVPASLIDYLYKGRAALNKNSKKKEQLSYRFPGIIEQKIRVASHFPLFRKPIINNINALKKMRNNNGCKTYLVSSRFGFLRKRTDTILNKYKLSRYFNGIYFNYDNKQPHLFKAETIKKLGIDTYIDDDLDLALYLSKTFPKLKIYWINPNNKINISLPANVTHISNLHDLLKAYE